ncbi:LacI family DNA-binding transcriptional regulator [Aliikangiella sp. G2MR2-5]|uniref:LacI family DNA-binding transcriptional regulator n=1 Tax=Aliikangiella sp. G2MR2-5 TaxID=2788943 RepID=UPI0018AB65E4|nr:LacI family DNA-binding transcriptional regulator [Aliikangiella sp. G2MR2-5]
MSKVTINVVAKHAGVSKKTVSRVLNDEPNVSAATKEKVKAVFKELGYRPSPVARGLATNRSFLIGLVYDNPNKAYVSDIQNGALSVCNDKGYHLLINPIDHESDDLLLSIEKLWTESRLDGLVLTPPFSDMQPLIAMLDQLNADYVRVGATLFGEDIHAKIDEEPVRASHLSPCVISNDEQAAFEMTRYLISLGHDKIGFVKGHPDHPVTEQRYEGYLKALRAAGLIENPDYIVQGMFDFRSGEDCGRQLLSLDDRPTAIFASNDYMAAGILKVASQKGIAVPHELAVTGFDNAPIARHLWPSLTTVKQPIEEMAAAAIEQLLARSSDRLQMDSVLVVRESTAPFQSAS